MGVEEASHSGHRTAESVLLHLTTITKPTATWDLFYITSFSRQGLFQRHEAKGEPGSPLSLCSEAKAGGSIITLRHCGNGSCCCRVRF